MDPPPSRQEYPDRQCVQAAGRGVGAMCFNILLTNISIREITRLTHGPSAIETRIPRLTVCASGGAESGVTVFHVVELFTWSGIPFTAQLKQKQGFIRV